jgi:hypothetical protein
MGNTQYTPTDKESYLDAKKELENVAWFFKENPVDKKKYKLWYEADNQILKAAKYKEFLPSFEEISEEMEKLLLNHSTKLKTSKNPIDDEDNNDYYWNNKYYDYKNNSGNSKIQYYFLCILHYRFMVLISIKLYFCNILKNKTNPTKK